VRLRGDPAPASGTLPPVRYPLIGGHHNGRVVEFDDPAPVFLRVAWQLPADAVERATLLYGPDDPDADAVAYGVDDYELQIHQITGQHAYVHSGLPK
jgi:hypothetical protein